MQGQSVADGTEAGAAPAAHPPVSVVIPAWKAATLLPRALDSIRAQSVQPAEVVVVDDASPDDTAAVAEGYRGLPIRVVRHAVNGGGGAALQTGLEAAANELVAFLDADDEWLPDKLERQLAALAAMPEAAAVGAGYYYVGRDGQTYGTFGTEPFPHAGDEFWRNMLHSSSLLQSSALVRRSRLLAVGGIDRTMRTGYDQKAFLALSIAHPIAYVHAPLVRYHDAPGSITKTARPADVLAILDMHETNIARLAGRLSAAERRALLARRNGEAANDLISARVWGAGLRCAVRAILGGDPAGPHLSRILANAPVVRHLKTAVRA